MMDFFAGQMDFIYFFYGLAFIMLAAVCYLMMRQKSQLLPWVWLGLFGLTHGIYEWIRMTILIAGARGLLQTLVTIFVILSYMFLVEFGRAGTEGLLGKGPGRKIHIPLLLVGSLGGLAGIEWFEISVRYSLGLVGGLWTAAALYLAGQRSGKKSGRWLAAAGAAIGLYALATAISVPSVPHPPASWLNEEVFLHTFGFPLAFLRGILAVVAAFALAAFSRMPSGETGLFSPPEHVLRPMVAVLAIVAAGWALTEAVGNFAKEQTLKGANLYANTLSLQLVRMMEGAENEALQKASSPEVIRALRSRDPEDLKRAYLVIASSRNSRFIDADLPFCYLIDSRGRTVLSSNTFNGLVNKAESPFISRMFHGDGGWKPPVSGVKGYYFLDNDLLAQSYYVAAPVEDEEKHPIGFVVVREPLADFQAAIAKHPFCFLVDPHGIVFLSSRSDLLFKGLWPLGEGVRRDLAASGQFGPGPFPSILREEVKEGHYASIDGLRVLVTRRHLGSARWSLVMMTPIREIRVYRMFAILATFVVCSLIIGFFGSLHFTRESAAQIALSERRHRSLVEGSPNCVILFDEDGRCVTINKSGLDLLGSNEDRVVGRRLDELWSVMSGGAPGDIIGAVLSGRRWVFDAESRRPDGRRIFWNAVLNPIVAPDGKIRNFVGIFTDVTERKEAEEEIRRYQEHLEEMVKERTSELSLANVRLNSMNEALRDSEERFRSLFDLASDSIFLLDPGSVGVPVVVDANIAACETNGYAREELIGKPITLLDDPESSRAVAGIVGRIMAGEAVTFDVNHVRKDGTVFPVEVSAQLIHLSGRPYILAIDRDITERMRMEDALREVSRQQEAILNNIPDLAWLKDGESRFIAVNGPMADACGFSSPDELVGKTDLDLWPEGLAEVYIADDKEVMNSAKRKIVEETMVDKDGNTRWIETIKTPIFNDAGEVIGTAGIARDITGRKKAEEELDHHREHLVEMVEERTVELKTAVRLLTNEINVRKVAEETLKQSETRFRRLSREFHTLLDAMADTLILLSPELEVMWVNRSAASAIGKTAEELTGQHCYTLWYKRSTPCDDCYALRSFASGCAEHSQLLTPSGKLIEAKAYPIKDEEGRAVSVIAVLSDITEKTTLQAEAMRASHLASLGELAAGVAHEINNPINGIINYGQILANRSAAGSKENDIAVRIIKEGDRIAGIVRSLLSFARERKEEKVPVAVWKILNDTITLTETQIRKDGIRLTIDMPQDLPEVVANPQQIEQVFLNIISNARYALNQRYPGSREEKGLLIAGEKIVIDNIPHVRITFRDRGVGIAADLMDKVMNPFFSTKPGGQGTGLGLSISHGIVRDHEGRLSLESVQGDYTIVRIDLPARGKDDA